MSKLLNKLKMKKSLKSQIESEKTGNKKDDPRFLNYYDLKENEKMSVLFVPFDDGEMWVKYKKHGPNLKVKGKVVRGVGDINCANTSSGVDCPACQMGFDLLNLEKETGDKSYRDEAKKWFGKQYTIMQCVVLEAPMEIQQSPDGNEIKLMIVPYGVEKEVTESITEGRIDEDDITTTPFIIKKTVKGEFASYDSSYFSRNTVDEETLALFDECVIEPYSTEKLYGDIIPHATTTEEVAEWVEKAEVLYLKETGQLDDEEEEEKAPAPAKKVTSLADRVAAKKSAPTEPTKAETPAYDEDVPLDLGEEELAPKKAASGGESIRDRLNRLKR